MLHLHNKRLKRYNTERIEEQENTLALGGIKTRYLLVMSHVLYRSTITSTALVGVKSNTPVRPGPDHIKYV